MGPCGLVPLPGTVEENECVRKRDKKSKKVKSKKRREKRESRMEGEGTVVRE